MATITSTTKINEDNTSATKFLQVALGDATDIYQVIFSLDKVSGVDITHGGGNAYDVPINYNKGESDNSSTVLDIVLAGKGTAVYTLSIDVTTNADKTAYDNANINYETFLTDTGTTDENGISVYTVNAGAPSQPTLNFAVLVSSSIEFVWE